MQRTLRGQQHSLGTAKDSVPSRCNKYKYYIVHSTLLPNKYLSTRKRGLLELLSYVTEKIINRG